MKFIQFLEFIQLPYSKKDTWRLNNLERLADLPINCVAFPTIVHKFYVCIHHKILVVCMCALWKWDVQGGGTRLVTRVQPLYLLYLVLHGMITSGRDSEMAMEEWQL